MGLGLTMMACLVVLYLCIAATFIYEGKMIFAAYWVFASGLTVCVLLMGLR